MVQFGPLGILNVCCFAGVLGGGMLKMKGFVSECNRLCYTLEGMLSAISFGGWYFECYQQAL